jgi:hypothetical protein
MPQNAVLCTLPWNLTLSKKFRMQIRQLPGARNANFLIVNERSADAIYGTQEMKSKNPE